MPHPSTEGQRLHALCAHAKSLGHDLTPFHFETFHAVDGASRIACCQTCGRHLSFGGSGAQSDALYYLCDGDAHRAREGLATLTGDVPRLLLARLTAAVDELPADVRRFFVPGHFDDKAQCLDSEDYVWRLEWHLRQWPNHPVAPSNPQPPDGIVELERRVPEDAMRPARYVGRPYNPNISEDPRHWLVQPLLPNTQGLAYRVDEGPWYFRRAEGVVGYYVAVEDVEFEVPDAEEALPLTAFSSTTATSTRRPSSSRSTRDPRAAEPEFPPDLLTGGALDPAVTGEWSP